MKSNMNSNMESRIENNMGNNIENNVRNNYRIIIINSNDNVGVAASNIPEGTTVQAGEYSVRVLDDIDAGHKVALKDIEPGETIVKYGCPIGVATADIKAGEYVHTHNLKTGLGGILEYSYNPEKSCSDENSGNAAACANSCDLRNVESGIPQFMGYVREDGRVGIRNEIWIINTVGCVNKTAEMLAAKAQKEFAGLTDGIFAFPHPYGCSQLGEDHTNTQKILAGLVNHPNAAGVLVLGLGCENNNIPEFKKMLGEYNPQRIKFLVTQEVEDEIEEGLKLIKDLVQYAAGFKRQPCPASKLTVGLKCGGSDAFSGITANPLVGNFSDRITSIGGISLLTEVPEMFGAEHLLMARCKNKELFDKTVALINNFKEYYIKHNQVIYENPSPGNKKGGISTLEEKSLGCTQKGGKSCITDVLDYGEKAVEPGLNLLRGPGNDIVACTALTASGAHMILFTTGRGTPLGAPVPTVKISTNTGLYERKGNWIDFNAGELLQGVSMEKLSDDLFNYVLKVASGEKTLNEKNNYREISIFKDGVTL